MEIQVDKLQKLMELLKPVIPKKSALPVLAYIRVGNGKADATDLETWVIADLPEAHEPMLLPYASIAEMLKYIPGSETLKIEAKNKMLSLAWSGGTASYPTEDVRDFPPIPEMPTRAEGLIDGDTLILAMLAALPYAATDTTRLVLNGVTLVLGNPIEVAAGDGFRMSYQVLGLSFPLEEKIIIPAHSVAILGHVFAKTPRTPPTDAKSLIPTITYKRQLRMALAGKDKARSVRVDFGQAASVIINLVDGTPPDFIQLIPKGEPILQSQLFAPQLEAAVNRVRAIAREGAGIIRLVFADGKVTISAKGRDEQEISATMDTLNTQGEPGRTALNYIYLINYLSGKQGIVTLSQYSKTAPLLFQYQNSPKVLIMPMFVDWGDEKPAIAEKVEPEPKTTEEHLEVEPGFTTVTEAEAEELDQAVAEEGNAMAEQETGEEPVAVAAAPTGKKRRRKAIP